MLPNESIQDAGLYDRTSVCRQHLLPFPSSLPHCCILLSLPAAILCSLLSLSLVSRWFILSSALLPPRYSLPLSPVQAVPSAVGRDGGLVDGGDLSAETVDDHGEL